MLLERSFMGFLDEADLNERKRRQTKGWEHDGGFVADLNNCLSFHSPYKPVKVLNTLIYGR